MDSHLSTSGTSGIVKRGPATVHSSRSGRPRDESIDERALEATRNLLLEAGWDGTSVRAVAVRSGTSRSALQRRWPTKAHLVLEAVLGASPDLAPFDGVDATGWIRWVAHGSVEIFTRPEMRAASPGLIAALREQPDLRAALWETFTAEAVEIYVRLQPAGHPHAALDARAIIVLAAGAALFADVLAGPDDTPELRQRIEQILLESPLNTGAGRRPSR